jgi:Flp pilus assembly protein TadG
MKLATLSPAAARPRRGITLVESALILPVFFLLVIGMIVAGLGVFRYEEVASLSREGSRWASVHGNTYAQATGNSPATAEDVYNQAILPNVVALDQSKLTYAVTWSPDNRQGSRVTVQVKYHWVPEAFLGGMDLASTSTAIVSY